MNKKVLQKPVDENSEVQNTEQRPQSANYRKPVSANLNRRKGGIHDNMKRAKIATQQLENEGGFNIPDRRPNKYSGFQKQNFNQPIRGSINRGKTNNAFQNLEKSFNNEDDIVDEAQYHSKSRDGQINRNFSSQRARNYNGGFNQTNLYQDQNGFENDLDQPPTNNKILTKKDMGYGPSYHRPQVRGNHYDNQDIQKHNFWGQPVAQGYGPGREFQDNRNDHNDDDFQHERHRNIGIYKGYEQPNRDYGSDDQQSYQAEQYNSQKGNFQNYPTTHGSYLHQTKLITKDKKIFDRYEGHYSGAYRPRLAHGAPGFRTRPLRTLRMINRKPAVAVQVNAQRKGILPVPNPTGNPFQRFIKVPKNAEQLKKLQIKLNLNSLAEAPRTYSERLRESIYEKEQMADESSKIGHLKIFERFEKIQNAQRALHPLTIKLINEKRGIFGEEGEVYPQRVAIHEEEERYQGKNPTQVRIQNKKLKTFSLKKQINQ